MHSRGDTKIAQVDIHAWAGKMSISVLADLHVSLDVSTVWPRLLREAGSGRRARLTLKSSALRFQNSFKTIVLKHTNQHVAGYYN